MSGRTITRYAVTCDGCGIERGTAGEYQNAVEARAALYSEGWRFPSRKKMNGEASANVSDVCTGCQANWEPQPAPDTWKNKR